MTADGVRNSRSAGWASSTVAAAAAVAGMAAVGAVGMASAVGTEEAF